MLVQALRKYSDNAEPVSDSPPAPSWFPAILTPKWAAPALALLLVAIGIGVWWFLIRNPPVDSGLVALNEAFATQRPVQSRVTGLEYARYSVTRGAPSVNETALNRSAAILLTALAETPSAQTHHGAARLFLLKREFDKAIAEFDEALKTAPNNAQLHSDLGAALLEKGKLQRAEDTSGRSETILARSHDHLNQALKLNDSLLDARFNRALLYEAMGLKPQAFADWEKYVSRDLNSQWTIEAKTHIEDIRKQSDIAAARESDLFHEFVKAQEAGADDQMWRVFTKSHLRNGNYITNALIDKYLDAASAGRQDETHKWSQALFRLGQLSITRSGDSYTADMSRAYSNATGNRLAQFQKARGLMKLGYSQHNQSKNREAIQSYEQAKTLFEQLGDHSDALLAQFLIAFCTWQGDDTESALPILTHLESQCAARNYKWLSAMTQNGLANVRERLAQYSQAVANSWTSHKLSREISDDNGALRALHMLANLYRRLGNDRQSLHFAQQGLDLGSSISADNSQMIGFYNTTALSFSALGHHLVALEFEKQAVALANKMGNPLMQSRYHVQMGLIQGMLNNNDQAIADIRSGIEIARKLGEEKLGREMVAFGQLFLARAYRNTNSFDEALSALSEVETFGADKKERWLRHETQKEQLLTRIAKGEIEGAKQALSVVLDSYEQQRETIIEESNRNTFFDKEQGIYDVAIDFATTRLGDARQAFNYSESSRARSRLDTFEASWNVQDNGRGPDLQFAKVVKPLALDQLKEKLPGRIQLVQFALLEDKVVIWYVANNRFESKTVNIGSDQVMAKVDQLLNLVSHPPTDQHQPILQPATELYDLLIQPVSEWLDRGKQLCIVPDKALNLLPFGVLFSSATQRYLVEDFALIYAASTNTFVRDTILAVERNQNSRETLLGIGNPTFDRRVFPNLDDLPSAEKEVSNIKEFYNAPTVLTEREPTKTKVQTAMRNADVLHLATHYISDSNSPLLSKLVLAGGKHESETMLYAHEIYRLKPLKSRLAILAGCQTGVEGYFNSEGAMGLARPFKAAGVPVVVATLWPVDSDATTDLMINFHRLRRREHHASAEALRLAQVQMLKFHPNPAYHHPYYWASFVQTGGYSDY